MSFKAEIKTYDDPKYYQNGIALATREEAESYGRNKVAAWTMAEAYQVVESDEPVNYTWSSAGLKAVEVKQDDACAICEKPQTECPCDITDVTLTKQDV